MPFALRRMPNRFDHREDMGGLGVWWSRTCHHNAGRRVVTIVINTSPDSDYPSSVVH